MSERLATVGSFFREALRAASPYGSWPTSLPKVISLFVGGVTVYSLTNTMKLVIISPDGSPMWQSDGLETRYWIIGVGFLILLVWSFSSAWVRFRWLGIGDVAVRVDHDYLLPLVNHGFSAAKVQVRIEEVYGCDEAARINPALGQPLAWQNPKASEGLDSGLVFRVVLFRAIYRNNNETINRINLVFFDKQPAHLQPCLIPGHTNEIWFRISVGSEANSQWFSVSIAPDNSGMLVVRRSNPPHIKPNRIVRNWNSCLDSMRAGRS